MERARVPPPRAVQRVKLSVDATTTWTAACEASGGFGIWLDQWNCGADWSPLRICILGFLIPLSITELKSNLKCIITGMRERPPAHRGATCHRKVDHATTKVRMDV